MELKQIEVYNFEELKDEVKEKVLNAFRERNDYYFLEESLTESLNALLEENKIKCLDVELRYSLSYCQGDGVSFVGNFEFKGFSFNIDLNSWGNHYQHSKTTNINLIEEDDDDETDGDDITEELKIITDREKKKISDEIEGEFEDIYFKICDSLEKEGYSYIESEDSEETIKENIEANEYKFLANGDIF